MINQLLLIGQIKEMECQSEKKGKISLEVERNYKNTNGIFEKDTFDCYLWDAISRKINSSCKNGDIVVLKGRLVEDEGKNIILAEQVILLNRIQKTILR